MNYNKLHDEIVRRLDIGENSTKVALWKWDHFIEYTNHFNHLYIGPDTCPYCIKYDCNICPFRLYGHHHKDCMAGEPFVSDNLHDDIEIFAKSMYNYIYDIAIVQVKEAVLKKLSDSSNINVFRAVLPYIITNELEYYGISDYIVNFDDFPQDVSIEELIEHIFKNYKYEE